MLVLTYSRAADSFHLRELSRTARNRSMLLIVEGLLDNTHRAEHPDYKSDPYFKKARAETEASGSR